MIQTQLKLRLNVTQETLLNSWLFMLTGVWNWAIRKIEHDAQGEIYYSKQTFQNLGKQIGIPSHTLQGILLMAHTAWSRCFQKLGGKPRLKLSLRLVQENAVIAFSKDNTKGMARTFGKSVASSAHARVRAMLAYKSPADGTHYIEVDSRHSTRICSACGCLSGPGPTGRAGLSVRTWVCVACGTPHDRDVNAAINTLMAGVGTTRERDVRHVA